MCGIVGYLGEKESRSILLDGLKELEYRGYDSAGIAILEDDSFNVFKAEGKLNNLTKKSSSFKTEGFSVGIGHTRWATHGKPNETNAHPHYGESTYIVHNGIIENYQKIKTFLLEHGVKFSSQTDTEVIVHLYEYHLKNHTAMQAFKKTLDELEGAYALLLVTRNEPKTIFFAKHGSPLIVGISDIKEEIHFGSSDAALIGKATNVIYLEDWEYGAVSPDALLLKDVNGSTIEPNIQPLLADKATAQKEGYRYFMEKEIYEQSTVISDTLMGRIQDNGIFFEELEDSSILNGINEIKICACGTSYHSALAASYLVEREAKIRVSVEIGSEFRYKEPLLSKDTLFLTISQSGETADTLESLKLAKSAGLKTLTICNVDNSSMVRASDAALLTRAGIEKGVASTKAFATQVAVLWMLALYLAQKRGTISREKLAHEIQTLRELPTSLKVKSSLHERLKRLSKRYLHGHGFFFIGRDVFYPLALEGALKLKEISYLHAEGYPSGEMKHGPIALADPELFTIALMPTGLLFNKMKSNVEELSARDSTICAISAQPFELADDFIGIGEKEHYMLEFFEMMVALQLLAMEISIRLENDVDMPRNLAKSVTVE